MEEHVHSQFNTTNTPHSQSGGAAFGRKRMVRAFRMRPGRDVSDPLERYRITNSIRSWLLREHVNRAVVMGESLVPEVSNLNITQLGDEKENFLFVEYEAYTNVPHQFICAVVSTMKDRAARVVQSESRALLASLTQSLDASDSEEGGFIN